MKPSSNAEEILKKRYYRSGEDWDGFLTRVVSFAARGDVINGMSVRQAAALEDEYAWLKEENLFWENSPYLMNAGSEHALLAACFVLPVEDSMEGIFGGIYNAALIQKYGGGTGFSFSRLRPAGDKVGSTGGVASGPVSFMHAYNAATGAVKQGGKRRGANMGILRVDHPDILEFINCKRIEGVLSNFNISVGITDSFMRAALAGDDYPLINPRTAREAGRLKAAEVLNLLAENAWLNGEPGVIFLDHINRANPTPQLGEIEATNPCFAPETLIATERGLERIEDLYRRVGDGYFLVLTDNRAGMAQVVNGNASIEGTVLRWARVFPTGRKQLVKVSLDNGMCIRVTPDHRLLTTEGWKEAGLLDAGDQVLTVLDGAQGGAGVVMVEQAGEDLVYDIQEPVTHSLIANGMVAHNCGETPLLPYEACNLGSLNLEAFVSAGQIQYAKLYKAIQLAVRILDNVIDLSWYPLPQIEAAAKRTRKIGLGVMGWANLLIKLGIPYDSERAERLAAEVMGFIYASAREASERLAKERGLFPAYAGSRLEGLGRRQRNAQLTCIAPTGTISRIAGTSSGVEPLFALSYSSHIVDGEFTETSAVFLDWLKEKGYYSEELLRRVTVSGSLQYEDGIPAGEKALFKTALEIPATRHLSMQAAFQQNGVDGATSKTINMPAAATPEEVLNILVGAWRYGLKGLTVYRNQSRGEQVLNIGEECPVCHRPGVVREDGCRHCVYCEYSECSIA